MTNNLEHAVVETGLNIFSLMKNEQESLFDKQYWLGRVMEWVMKDPSFKIDLFRFVDVLPMLNTSDQIAAHVKEYLMKSDRDVPLVMNTALKAASFSLTQGLAAKAIKKNVIEMAERFIAGENIDKAHTVIRKLSDEGFCFTIDLLGEKTLSEQEADDYQKRYLHLINELPNILKNQAPNNPPNVSVKISALSCHLYETDVEFAKNDLKKRVLPLLVAAKNKNVFINFDVENYQSHEILYALFEDIALSPEFKSWPYLGIVVQAYLQKSAEIAQNIIHLAKSRNCPITIRLVKGAYWDYEVITAQQHGHHVPVFTNKESTDHNYEKLTAFLLDNISWVRPAFASHNIRSLSHALAYAQSKSIPTTSYEIQMLYGMAEAERKAFLKLGHTVRLYMPLGEMLPGMSYLVRRLLENTSQIGFLRLSHHDQTEQSELLKKPQLQTKNNLADDSLFHNVAALDFTDQKTRDDFKTAIGSVYTQFPCVVPIVINGEEHKSTNTIKHLCPSDTNTIIAQVFLAEQNHAEEAIKHSLSGYENLSELSFKERAQHLEQLARLLEKDRMLLAATICYEVGKTWSEADADVAEAIDFCNYYAFCARTELEPQKLGSIGGEYNILSFQGRGPAVVIAPWNFPLAILCGMSVAAYVSGNPIIMKPAEQSSLIGHMLYTRMIKAGFLKSAVHFLPGIGEKIGPYLVKHPKTALICFTGSKKVGHEISKSANTIVEGQVQMKRVICEMGGKNAIIVDDDADLDEAVTGIINSAFIYAGQKCSAASRVILINSIAEPLINRLIEATKSLRIGTAHIPNNFMGPVIDKEAYDRLNATIEKIINDKTITTLFVGERPKNGYFIPPILALVNDRNHWLMQEELFGPIVAIFKTNDLKEALNIANATGYALTGAIFSRSPKNIAHARQHFMVGNLYINQKCTGARVYRQPFGGFKMSGTGIKAGGPHYLLQFVDAKVISENTMRRGFSPEISL